jgi:hypothetical protein
MTNDQTPGFTGTLTFENGNLSRINDKPVQSIDSTAGPPRGQLNHMATVTVMHTTGSQLCTVFYMGRYITFVCG